MRNYFQVINISFGGKHLIDLAISAPDDRYMYYVHVHGIQIARRVGEYSNYNGTGAK